MEYIDLVKDYIYEITWHIESELRSKKNFVKDTRCFWYTGSSIVYKTEEELTQNHIPWGIFLGFNSIFSFSKGRYTDGKEYISLPNPVEYSRYTKIIFDKVVPYAPKQIIDALTN